MSAAASSLRTTRGAGARTRESILEAAASLATVHGLEGLSIGGLAAHIGMSKSGLFAHFGSKEELQLATVETAAKVFDADVVAPTRSERTPLAQLTALCDRFLSHVERRVFPGGCFFASAGAELDTHPGAVQTHVANFTRGWMQRLADLVRAAQDAGELDADEDPAQVAFDLEAYMLLANNSFLLTNDPDAIRRARIAIRRRLAPAGD